MAEGEFALVMSRLETALGLPGQPVKRGTMAHEHIVYMMLVDTAARAGDLAALDRYVPQLEELAARDQHKPYLAVAKRAAGVAQRLRGRLDEAEHSLNEAAEAFQSLEMDWQLGRTLAELGRLESKKGDLEKAEQHFNRAMDLFEKIGARDSFNRARASMNEIQD